MANYMMILFELDGLAPLSIIGCFESSYLFCVKHKNNRIL